MGGATRRTSLIWTPGVFGKTVGIDSFTLLLSRQPEHVVVGRCLRQIEIALKRSKPSCRGSQAVRSALETVKDEAALRIRRRCLDDGARSHIEPVNRRARQRAPVGVAQDPTGDGDA